MGIVQNNEQFMSGCLASAQRIEPLVNAKMTLIANVLHSQIMSRTPVWSGSVIRNFVWSANTPISVQFAPIDNGPPGPTNSMPLGSEPRRGPNEEASWNSLRSINFKIGTNYFLTNNDPDARQVEAGVFPPPPFKVRSSAMVARAVSFVRTRFGV